MTADLKNFQQVVRQLGCDRRTDCKNQLVEEIHIAEQERTVNNYCQVEAGCSCCTVVDTVVEVGTEVQEPGIGVQVPDMELGCIEMVHEELVPEVLVGLLGYHLLQL